MQTKDRILRIRHHPRHHIATKPIEYRHEKHNAAVHGNIGHICAPHLIRPVNDEIPHKIGIDRVSRMGTARVRAGCHSVHTHQTHEQLDPFTIDLTT